MSNWKIDSIHSSVDFKVKHMGVSFIKGQVFGVEGNINFDPLNISQSSFEGELDLNTISSGMEFRDVHLKGPDFFDVSNNPKPKFKSNGVKEINGDKFTLTGTLTLKNITKEIEIEVEFLGTTKKYNEDGTQNDVVGFTATTSFNRTDFGINWNVELPTGKLLVGNEVNITIEVEAIK